MIQFFSHNSDVWFGLSTLIASLMCVIITALASKNKKVKTTIFIISGVIFIASCIVVIVKYTDNISKTNDFTNFDGDSLTINSWNNNGSDAPEASKLPLVFSTPYMSGEPISATPSPSIVATFNDLKIIAHDGTHIEQSTYSDTFGNFYNNELVFWSEGAYAIFAVDKAYSYFSGTLAFCDKANSNERKSTKYVTILADGIEVYSNAITASVKPTEFYLNISDVDQIEIHGNAYLLIGNSKFYN